MNKKMLSLFWGSCFLLPLGVFCSDSSTQTSPKAKEEFLVASPAYDFSFKKVFKEEKILMGFLNCLYYPNAGTDDLKIRMITYDDDFNIIGGRDKHIYFDIACTCEAWEGKLRNPLKKKTLFDVEMQRKSLNDYLIRSIYYGTRRFARELKSGETYDSLIPVRVVSFMKEIIDSTMDTVFSVNLTKSNQEEGNFQLLSIQPIQWTYIQLGENKKIPEQLQEWINLMNTKKEEGSDKYLCTIDKGSYKNEDVLAAIDVLGSVAKEFYTDYIDSIKAAQKDELVWRSLQKEATDAKAKQAEAEAKQTEAERKLGEAELATQALRKELDDLKRKNLRNDSPGNDPKKQKTN